MTSKNNEVSSKSDFTQFEQREIDPNSYRSLFKSDEEYFEVMENDISQHLNAFSYDIQKTLDVISEIEAIK